jgi:quercetin dioxygenase-like cupin family protein
MDSPFTYIADLAAQAAAPADGILSRTVLADGRVKAVLFGFAPGQELSEHTASVPAVLQFVSGEAEVGLGDETRPAGPGTWIHMPAGLKHAIRARTPVVVMLLMLRGGEAGGK